jgi:competence protein ComEC
LLKLTTTLRRFSQFANDIQEVRTGFWYYMELEPGAPPIGMRAWFASLTARGATDRSIGRLVKATRLFSSIDPVPRLSSLGAATAPAQMLPQGIASLCRLSKRSSRISAIDVLARVQPADNVLIHDVGQGSFVTLLRGGEPCLHFDAGSPTVFNWKGARKEPFSLDFSERVPIVLSHWDWDHFHAAMLIPSLRRCRWVVPDQIVGPGAARLAIGLARTRRLYVWDGGVASFPIGDVGECIGVDKNGSGLALHARLTDGRVVLLAGDADYHTIPFGSNSVDALVATHHGGRPGSPLSLPPQPRSRAPYIISYGYSNTYGHPHEEALSLHEHSGWGEPLRTARFGSAARGDRYL